MDSPIPRGLIAYYLLQITLVSAHLDPDLLVFPSMGVCWRDSYGRGVGKVPTRCADNYELDGALCYPKCADGYKGVGPVCWQYCQDGWKDIGAMCTIPLHIYFPCPWYDICGLTFARGCKTNCSEAYRNDGCSCRRPARFMTKKSYGRTAGRVPSCKADLENDLGLCYQQCRPRYEGMGPVCWMNGSGNGNYTTECSIPIAFGRVERDCDDLSETLKEAGITTIVCLSALVQSIIVGDIVGMHACRSQIAEVLPKLWNTPRCSKTLLGPS